MNSKYTLTIFQYLLFLSFLSIILSQSSTDLTLNKTVIDVLYQDDSYKYYKLKLPSNLEKNKFLLVFTIKESQQGSLEGDELFSDPDLHISKSKFPKNKDDAQWYSQKYGNDILTIPSEEVEGGEEFFITMYCEYKCRYELNSYLAEEVEIEIGKINTVNLSPRTSLSYYINIGPENFDELNLVATSPNLKSFKIFMSKDSPSSQNTFRIIPSWTGGYMISVERYSYTKDYCTNCKYHILIQSMEDIDVTVQFYAYFQDTVTNVIPWSVIYDVTKKDKKRCYSFDIKKLFSNMNEKLMIQTSLFSGSTLLYISGAKKDLDKNINDIMTNTNLNSYTIQNEKILMLTTNDIEQINSKYSYLTSEEKNTLYFCIYGKDTSSYILNVYPLSEASKVQKYNYISPGTELTGYLNGKEVTRYRILDFNNNKNSNISITFTNIKGKSNFYSNFCYEKCNFNNELLKNKIDQDEMLYPQDSLLNSFTLKITPEMNKCYKNDIINNNRCKILLVVQCTEDKDNFCGYKILVSISENPTMMSPKKTFYNVLPKSKADFYELIVEDITIPSVVIVLTTVTGDAELAVYRKENINDFSVDSQNMKLVGVSMNNDYIPDVVRITPNKIGRDNISGRYFIKITGKCFSSYNLYYYTTKNKAIEKQISIGDITASLKEGQIIRDFFPNDIEYKIYIYTPETEEEKDIKIILTRINVEFSFKVFDDFQSIKINYLNNNEDIFEEKIKGYLWASDQNNEVTISIKDKYYSSKKSYFIVVYKNKNTIKDEEKNNDLNRRSMMMYYIGVTKMGIPFTLHESIEHSETLNDKYFFQNYFYLHNDISQPFHLDVNVLSGEVDILVNTNPISFDNIDNKDIQISQNSISAKLNVNNYAFIELDSLYFHNYCTKNNIINNNNINNPNNYYNPQSTTPCQLYIYIVQSKSSKKYQTDSQYIISAKSSINTGKILLSGQIISGEILPNKTEHFIIEEVKRRKGSSINVKFKEGFGDLYVRIPKNIESGSNMTFPSEKNYDYKGRNAYMGQIVMLPSKIFDRIDSSSIKLQILISIVASDFYTENNKNVKYTISYSSEPKRLNQNKPYTTFISAGEYHFYTLYFNQNTQNIYIALSNMNGDADLYLNYGIDKLPSPTEHDWYSVNMGHEYIDISENHDFFKKKKLKTMAGYYSLLVVGFTETTYTLFISSHDDNIFPLNDNTPISCRCESKGDKCFYRYDNIFKTVGDEANLNKNSEIIFTSQYIYGNGRMYANLLKDQDITGENNKKFQDYFPTEKIYQFSNKEYGKRNYMKVTVPEEKYSKDSLILMTFICEEKTDVEITAASLSYQSLYNYLDKDRENIFYLKFNETQGVQNQLDSTFTFYSYKDDDIIYEIKAYIGIARIKVYTNETRYNTTTNKLSYDFRHISEFTLRSDEGYKYQSYKIFTENYINSISGKNVKGKRIYFSVKPLTDFGFYLQILYDREWINVPINKDKTYLIKNDNLYGYFDIYQDFQNIEMSLSLNDFIEKTATVYIKLMVIEKDSLRINSANKEERLYHYEIPGKYNYDYLSKTNKYLGTINININNIPIIKENERDKKFVRALFNIELQKNYFPTNINQRGNNQNQLNNDNTKKDSYVRILVAPGVNNFKRVDVPPYNYYFSNTSLISQSGLNYNGINNNMYNGNKEIKIYSLDKINEKDDKMIIQIDSCQGNYDIKLSKKIVTYDDNENDLPYEEVGVLQGKSTYVINSLRNKHVYLSIKSAQNEYECNSGKEIDSKNNTCAKELSYLLYYYTTSGSKLYSENNIYCFDYRIDSRANIYVIMPRFDRELTEYNLIWTRNQTYAKYFESVCYLSNMFNNEKEIDNTTVFIEKNVELNDRNEIYVKNLYLSSEPVYLNILARNRKNNKLISFKPITIIYNRSIMNIIIYIVAIASVFFIIYYFYEKIRNKLLEYYWGRFGFNTIFRNKKETIKYTNLSDNYY